MSSWTDERVQLLKKLWMEGLSASQIADELGDVTRNAVIGKVHRLGLPGRPKTASSIRRVRKVQRSSMPRVPTIEHDINKKQKAEDSCKQSPPRTTNGHTGSYTPRFRELFIPPAERVAILDLNENTCKWPIGDPSSKDFHFCGRKTKAGMPYCKYHCNIAYPPASTRKWVDRRIEIL